MSAYLPAEGRKGRLMNCPPDYIFDKKGQLLISNKRLAHDSTGFLIYLETLQIICPCFSFIKLLLFCQEKTNIPAYTDEAQSTCVCKQVRLAISKSLS